MAESSQNHNCLTIARQLFDYSLAMNKASYSLPSYILEHSAIESSVLSNALIVSLLKKLVRWGNEEKKADKG